MVVLCPQDFPFLQGMTLLESGPLQAVGISHRCWVAPWEPGENLERTWSNRSPPNSIPVLSQTPAAAPGGSQAAGQVTGGCRYSLPLASNMGPRYPDAGSKMQTHFSLHCSHKGSRRVTQPKLSPWEGSLVSKQWTRETGRRGLCRRGAEQGSQRGQGSQRCGYHLRYDSIPS